MTTELGPVLLRGIPFGSARHIRRDIKDMPDTDPPAVQAGTSSAARSHPPTPAPKLTLVLALGAGAGGALLAVQSRINGALAHALGPGHAITAALISFAGGLALLCAVVALSRHRRAALAELRRARVPAWSYLGGLAGVAFVSSAAYATPVTGVAFLMVCVIVGQMIGGLVIDAWGIGPGGKRPITARRLVAALMAVGAVVVNANGHLPAGAGAALLPLLTVVGALLSLSVALVGHPARSQATRTIKVVVPFPPGGGTDFLARLLTEQIGRAQGPTMVIEDRLGGRPVGRQPAERAQLRRGDAELDHLAEHALGRQLKPPAGDLAHAPRDGGTRHGLQHHRAPPTVGSSGQHPNRPSGPGSPVPGQ